TPARPGVCADPEQAGDRSSERSALRSGGERGAERTLLERGDFLLEPLRDLAVRDEALAVRRVVEACQHVGVGAEALDAERDDDGLAAFGRRALDEGLDPLLGGRALVRPVLAERLDLHAAEGRAGADGGGARVELREPPCVLAVIAGAVREDED